MTGWGADWVTSASPLGTMSAMPHPKPAKQDEPSPFTMDDIARRFLSIPPEPHKPAAKAKPAAKKKVRKPAK